MKLHLQPWWILALQLPLLETHLTERQEGQRNYYCFKGRPQFQSLIWLVYGPSFSLVAIFGLSYLAWQVDIRAQMVALRFVFVGSFILIPAIFWVVSSYLLHKLSQIYLQRYIAENPQEVELLLDSEAQTLQVNQNPPLKLANIMALRLASDSGVYYTADSEVTSLVHLVALTAQGEVTLLPKELGYIKQKIYLIRQLEEAKAAIETRQ